MSKPDHTCIFVVEDDLMYSRTILHLLESRNFLNVRLFSHGEECLEHLHLDPDVILLDYWLGDGKKNGMEVMEVIRRKSPKTKVIFLTAMDNLKIAQQTMAMGAYDYVVKSESALERVKNLLRRIVFENQIQEENRVLRRSRRLILVFIFLLIVGLAGILLLKQY
ncbi:MAG: response regulator [Bacteroidales bacterium]|jgi:DNA-binding NtrC family response regulator|nr:response regulator [Bacteroidales bacterium]NLM92523.1 response regulator [Bacteroidales bacterium]